MTDLVRVYVNARAVEVPTNATLLDAVTALDATLGAQVVSGERALADSRGLPVPADSRVFAGAIVRVISGRSRPGASTE